MNRTSRPWGPIWLCAAALLLPMIAGCSPKGNEFAAQAKLPAVNTVVPAPDPRPKPKPGEDLGRRSARFADYGDAQTRKLTTACANYQTIVTANGGVKGWCAQ